MVHSNRTRTRAHISKLSYEAFEPRKMLATISVGDLNSGVAVSEDATGVGYILYSQEDVHTRFSGIRADNADHFIAARLDGIQWQYNDDSRWVDFETEVSDVLVAKVNFDGDAVIREYQGYVQGVPVVIPHAYPAGIRELVYEPSDLYVVANQFGSQFDKNEFQVLGRQFETFEFPPETDLRLVNIGLIRQAAWLYEAENGYHQELFELANFDNDGNPLLSWRVHLLPYLGYDNLYQQFNLDEPWNSPHNLALSNQMPAVFDSPYFESSNRTPYLASAGENSTFKLDGPATNVFDENSLAFVEVDASHAVVWTQPVDWYFNEADPFAGLGNASANGLRVSSTRGGPYYATDQIDPTNFANFVTVGEGELIDYREFETPFYSRSSLRQLGWAALNFESAHQHFPAQSIKAADGTPLLSWRVALLPFLGENELYQRFNLDEAWDSPHNIQLLDKIPYYLQHADVEHGKTVFLALNGEGTVFDSGRERAEINLGRITDGSTNTILFVEADVSQAVEWSRPVDLNYDAANPTNGLGGITDDGTFNAVLADASDVSFDTSAPQLLDAWATYDGGEINDETVLADGFSRFAPVEDQLRRITQASLNFESANQEFPRTIYSTPSASSPEGPGVPLLSWRVAILPYIEQQNLYDQFNLDEPWDSPHNLSLLPLMPQIFATEGIENGKTVFQGAHGDNTFFSNDNNARRFAELNEHNTAAILQVNSDQAIEWTKPGDFDFDPNNLQSVLGNATASGFHFSLIDGSVHFFNKTIGDDVLKKILSPADFTDLAVDLKVFREDSRSVKYGGWIEKQNKLRHLSLAALDYESANQNFPQHAIYSERPGAGGTPLLSWRVELLPYLGEHDLYQRFNLDEPWDSPHNLSLLPLMPEVFKLPNVENGKTTLQAITSHFNSPSDPRTMFPLGNQVRTGFSDIQDGIHNTLLFAEVDAGLAVEWTKPQDIVFNPNDPGAGLAATTPARGTHVVFADGFTSPVPTNLREEIWGELAVVDDGGLTHLLSPSSYVTGTIVPASDPGDVNLDGALDFSDIPSFISALANSEYQIEADVNRDGLLNFEDISAFIATLIGPTSAPDVAAPEITVASGTVVEGETLLLTQSNLQATDSDSTEADLEFVLESLPHSGQVLLDGAVLGQFDSFTQQDVTSGLVEYAHNGNNTLDDGFGFLMRDPAGNESGSLSFAITVTPDQGSILGDVNLDGIFDFADIPSFISVLSAGEFQEEGDINRDGVVDFADIPAFIERLILR